MSIVDTWSGTSAQIAKCFNVADQCNLLKRALAAYGLASVKFSQTHPGAFMSLRIWTMSSANSLRLRSFRMSAAASAA